MNARDGATADDAAGQESPADALHDWFTSRIPADWLAGSVIVQGDREELTVVIPIEMPQAADAASGAERAAIRERHSRWFRENTRQRRMEIARDAEHLYGRKISWGVHCDDETYMFTTVSVPVMTRLRQGERLVLDTLVDAGVARSRSDALAWCVRLVGEHEQSWLADLRAALRRVQRVRADGPRSA